MKKWKLGSMAILALLLPALVFGQVGGGGSGGLSAPVALSSLDTQSAATIVGRASGAGTGVPVALTAAQTRAIIAPLPLTDVATQAEATILGRAVGAGTGVPVALTAAQVRDVAGQAVTQTVVGGATTSFSLTGIPSAGRYLVCVYILQAAAGSPAYYMYMNGVTTGYTRTYLVINTTSPSSGGDSLPVVCNSDSAGDKNVMYAIVENVGGRLQITGLSNQIDRAANQLSLVAVKSTETALASITITSSVANLIDNGSYCEVYVLR